MNNRLKEIAENLDNLRIGVDDTFKFGCNMCGKCCIHREDILLSPKDLYKISRELGLRPPAVVKEYCEVYLGSDSRMPIVRLQPRGTVRRCPFLQDRKCSIHSAKPTVCATFPVGRCMKREATGKDISFSTDDIIYIFSNPGCGNTKEEHTVREWFSSFGIPLDDDYFIKWQETVVNISQRIKKMEEKFQTDTMETIWNSIYGLLYLNYDPALDFMEQFEKNRSAVFLALDITEAIEK